MIVDAHVHIHPNQNGFGKRYDARLNTLLRLLEKSNIDKVVLLPIYPKVTNDFIGKACQEYPDRLIGFASVDPLGGRKSIEKLEHDVLKYNLKGLKLHPRLQGFNIGDKKVKPLIQKAIDLDLPITIDAFLCATEAESHLPYAIGQIATSFPKAKIIMAHFGGHKLWDALFVAKAHKNIFVDLSYTLLYFKGSSLEKDIGFAIKRIGSHRCIYGSDHPEMGLLKTLKASLGILTKYRLSTLDMANIMGGTISSLLNLER